MRDGLRAIVSLWPEQTVTCRQMDGLGRRRIGPQELSPPQGTFQGKHICRIRDDLAVARRRQRPILIHTGDDGARPQRADGREGERLELGSQAGKGNSVPVEKAARRDGGRAHEPVGFVAREHFGGAPARGASAIDLQEKRLEIRGRNPVGKDRYKPWDACFALDSLDDLVGPGHVIPCVGRSLRLAPALPGRATAQYAGPAG